MNHLVLPNGCAIISLIAFVFWLIIGFGMHAIYQWATAPDPVCKIIIDGKFYNRDEFGHLIDCEES